MSAPGIASILVSSSTQWETARSLSVGIDGVTLIKMVRKPGPYADIPFLRVYKGDQLHSEWNQLNIVGTFFFGVAPEEAA